MITNFEGYHQFCGVAFNKSNQHRHDFASLRNDKNVPKQPKNLITSNHERNYVYVLKVVVVFVMFV